jgi:hypothetical protein
MSRTIGWYRGPRTLWERDGSSPERVFEPPEFSAAKLLYRMLGGAAPEAAEYWCNKMIEEGRHKGAENLRRALEEVRLFIEKQSSADAHS